jgi:hypothetical protein
MMIRQYVFGLVTGAAVVLSASAALAEAAVYTLRPLSARVTPAPARAAAPAAVPATYVPAAYGYGNDPFICHREINRTERLMGIPPQLLESVALTESGRWNKNYKRQLAWPWTVNAAGKGYYLNSKAEAIAKVRQLQRAGISRIDVGCMQVNLHFHKEAFPSLEAAFEPAYNVRYAGKFLTDLKNRHRNWSSAVGYYHSGTPELHNRYRYKVLQTWRATRTAYASRGGVGGTYAQARPAVSSPAMAYAMRQRLALLEQRRLNRIRVASYND